MNEAAFREYLKRAGKKPAVIERNVRMVEEFAAYVHQRRGHPLDAATRDDIEAFVQDVERRKRSAKGALYVLMNYFRFLGADALRRHAATLREARTRKTRRIFPLKEFLKVDQGCVQKLAAIGVTNVEQMLENGRTKAQRMQLATRLKVPEAAILELVKLSDITRVGYVKRKLSRLYYEAGLDSPAKIAAFEPSQLHAFFVKFVAESGWDGMVPNPKDLVNNIANARQQPNVVEE